MWNTGEEGPNLAHKPRQKEGYFPVPAVDSIQDLRTKMMLTLEALGCKVEAHHHEVATAGQAEIDMRFTTLTRMADNLMLYKYVVRNVARKHDMTATFMPKPMFDDNGSGMHVHQSLWKGEHQPVPQREGYAGLSESARNYIGGLLRHAWALCALLRSHHQLLSPARAGLRGADQSGLLAAQPVGLLRIPMYSSNPKAKRIEFRTPDPPAIRYLAFAAMLMAGLDGIEHEIDPGDPSTRTLRSAACRGARHQVDARLAAAGPRRARGRPWLPAAGRRLHQGRDRNLAKPTSGRGRSMPLRCARTPTSSTSITISSRLLATAPRLACRVWPIPRSRE